MSVLRSLPFSSRKSYLYFLEQDTLLSFKTFFFISKTISPRAKLAVFACPKISITVCTFGVFGVQEKILRKKFFHRILWLNTFNSLYFLKKTITPFPSCERNYCSMFCLESYVYMRKENTTFCVKRTRPLSKSLSSGGSDSE